MHAYVVVATSISGSTLWWSKVERVVVWAKDSAVSCSSNTVVFSQMWRKSAEHKYCCYTLQLTQQQPQQLFYGPLSRTTRVSQYQMKRSTTTTLIIIQCISFFHLLRSIASSLFKLCAWQSYCTTSLHILFGLPLGLEPSTSYSIHFFTQSAHAHTIATCFAVVSILYNLFLVFLSTPYFELTGQVSLPCSTLLCTQLLYSLPLLTIDMSLLVSSGTNCLNLFHPIWILASTAALASPSTLSISPW